MNNLKLLLNKNIITKQEYNKLSNRLKNQEKLLKNKNKKLRGTIIYVHSECRLQLTEYNGGKIIRVFNKDEENYSSWSFIPSDDEIILYDIDIFKQLYNYNIRVTNYTLLGLSLVSETHYNENFQELNNREINVQDPIKYLFSVSNDMNINDDGENCLINALYNMYNKHIPTLTNESLKTYLDKYKIINKRNYYTFFDCNELLEEYKIPYYLCDIRNTVMQKHSYNDTNHNYPAFIASIIDDHIYLVTDQHTRMSIVHKIKNNKSHMVEDTKINEVKENLNFICDVSLDELDMCTYETVFYNIDNLKTILYDFYQNEKIMFKNTFFNNKVTKILYEKNGKKITLQANANKIHNLSIHTVKRFCNLFHLPFNNQSLTSLAWELFNICRLPEHQIKNMQFNKKTVDIIKQKQQNQCNYCLIECENFQFNYKTNNNNSIDNIQGLCNNCFNHFKIIGNVRENFNKKTKKQIIINQENKCNMCCVLLNNIKFEYDHIIRVADGGKNNIENCQALCVLCHVKKTTKEDNFKFFEKDYLISSYNNITLDIFNIKKNAFIQCTNNGVEEEDDQFFGIDINKCRRNILYYSLYDYCVYSSLDEPTEFNGVLQTGYFYLELFTNPIDQYKFFPLKFNGWYSYPIVQFCLDEKIITLDHIKYQLLPSLIINHKYFQTFIDFVMNKYPTDKEFEPIFKKLFNCFIGCMGSKKDNCGTICFTKNEKEAAYTKIQYKDNVYKDSNNIYHLINSKENTKTDNMVPIFNQILDLEAVELYKIHKQMQKYDTNLIYLNTDQVVCKINNSNHLINLKSEFENIYWDEAKTVLKYKQESMIKHKNDIISWYEPYDFILEKKEWNLIQDPGNNDFKTLAQAIIDTNKSIHINGCAGTGKSFLIKNIIQLLKEDTFYALAPTNVACRIINGTTLHLFCKKLQKIGDSSGKKIFNKFSKIQYIIVDEISMVKEVFYRFFNIIKNNYPYIKWIICGDFDQLKPVNDIKDFDYANCNILKYVCDYNKLNLTKCRRADQEFFNDYTNPLNIDMHTYTVANEKNNKKKHRSIKKFICYHNKLRKEINSQLMIQISKKRKYILLKNKYPKNQDIYIYKGLPLIGYINNTELNIYNGEDYIITDFDTKNITIKECAYNKSITIPIEKITKFFMPAYCVTVHKSQGKTFNFPYCILEWSILETNMKYVALSRGTKKEFVNICL